MACISHIDYITITSLIILNSYFITILLKYFNNDVFNQEINIQYNQFLENDYPEWNYEYDNHGYGNHGYGNHKQINDIIYVLNDDYTYCDYVFLETLLN